MSCCALGVDTGVLLTLNRGIGVPYLPAACLSFVVGGVVAYQLCIRFVWPACRADARPSRLLSFLLLGTVGLFINAAVMATTVDLMHWSILSAKALSAACTFLGNYWLRRRWAFQSLAAQMANE